MVSFKALIISATALCYRSNVLVTAAAVPSASVPHMAADPSIKPQKEGNTVKEQAFDGFGDFLGDVVFPVALGKQCKTLTFVSKNLDNILKRYTGLGLVCNAEIRKLIDENVDSSDGDGTTNFISQVTFPIAFQSLQDMADKIRAQTECLDYVLTGISI